MDKIIKKTVELSDYYNNKMVVTEYEIALKNNELYIIEFKELIKFDEYADDVFTNEDLQTIKDELMTVKEFKEFYTKKEADKKQKTQKRTDFFKNLKK